jgi:hypothetical protein
MVKKVKKKIKKKKIVVRTDPPISINYEQNENKTLETIKSWGYGIIGIVVILSIFSGFKYPWKWIDALYETQNEKIEIIANKWSNAYRPLVIWCAGKSQLKKNSKYSEFENKPKIKNIKNYIISLTGGEKKCLEDKDFRIELINFPIKKVKENEILNEWFNKIPPHIKNFDFTIEENTNYKTERFNIETNLFFWSDIFRIDEDDFDLNKRSQMICAYSKNIGLSDDKCRYRSIYFTLEDEQQEDSRMKIFSIDFLNQKDFILMSKGCFNGCVAEITYVSDMKKNNIRGLKILQPNLKTWSKYSDKSSSTVKEYDSLINKTDFIVNELEKNYLKPEWFRNIEIQ